MKNLIIFATLTALMVSSMWIHAQPKFDPSAIVLGVIIPEEIDGFPDGAKTVLANKLTQVASTHGVSAYEYFSRFFITAIPALLTKDIVPGPPQQIAQSIEITFYIADYFDQKIFASTTLNCKGVGTNDNKAYIDAIKNVSSQAPQFKTFIETGKKKIMEYYAAQCDNIIKKAYSLSGQKNFEEAIYMLTAIPEAVPECFDKGLAATKTIYQQYIDHLCDVHLALAKTAWMAEQNSSGAQNAGEYLRFIYPDAYCYRDAEKLYKEIKSKVLDDWKFEMKKYQDGVNLESQRISAWRDVGVSYGNNQQPTTTNVNWIGR
jgi:hypothetical protein